MRAADQLPAMVVTLAHNASPRPTVQRSDPLRAAGTLPPDAHLMRGAPHPTWQVRGKIITPDGVPSRVPWSLAAAPCRDGQ